MSENLDDNLRDKLVAAARGAVSAVPLVGGILAEIITQIIPTQRQDRIVSYLRKLEARLAEIERDKHAAIVSDPERVDLIEAGAYSAARATNDDRIDKIAELVFAGISHVDANIIRRKRLLGLLDQIDDDELLILNAYAQSYAGDGRDAWDRVAIPDPVHLSSAPTEVDNETFYELGKSHLLSLGLLRLNFSNVKKGELPEWDKSKGRFKGRMEISRLGRALLKACCVELPF